MSKTAILPECGKEIGMKGHHASPTDKKEGAIGMFSRFLRFESLKRSPESPTTTDPPISYYGVYIPCEIKKGPDEETLHVYKTKAQAMELVKRYKLSRFKAFRNYQDAVSFALRGAETTDTVDGNDNTVFGEKPYPFKSPSPQEMVSLRRAIEGAVAGSVRDRVWDNPRYLVSSGNTPAILQEGSRYNALHVAAKAKNAEICNLILNTVGDPDFVHTLYGGDADFEACKEFASILVDRYLNTPDKSMNETPLHFAAKFGADEVVDVLTSFKQCNKDAVNKFGETARSIICQRCRDASPALISRISTLLEDRYYVPVMHSEDNSSPPTIGKPFTPANPPCINSDPLSPRYEIRAFAGPMDPASAGAFRKRWKTPPRNEARFRLGEITKGLENVGRNLAEQMKVGWKEYWPFLDTFTDLRSTEGLNLLENYLKTKYDNNCSFAYTDSCAQSQTIDPVMSLSICHTFGHTSTPVKDILSPMTELCMAMNTCKISETSPVWKKTDPIRQRMCRQPIRSKLINGEAPIINHTVSQLLCIERTCQVFAKRIADALNFSLTAELEVAGECLKNEAKRLQHTINTYMDDERFAKINFALIHSRLAQLVVSKLKQQTKDLDDINTLVEYLDKHSPITYKGPNRVKLTIDSHVKCLASYISSELSETESTRKPAVSEIECLEIWDQLNQCSCDWKVEQFERQGRKNTSFRNMKNRSALSTGSSDGIIRRLSFDYDIGDGKQLVSSSRPISVNSPAGDSADTYPGDKCSVAHAEISSDDSDSDSDADSFATAADDPARCDDDMHDASDRALVEPFIYGEEPTKVDRLVWDAISTVDIDVEKYPNIARWRHTVALYTQEERNSWQPPVLDDSIYSYNTSWCNSPMKQEAGNCSTPTKCESPKTLPLQVSNWLRVTGPNSPRSALATKNISHNVSFGF